MTSAKKADQLKLLGIWLPPEEKRQIKVAAAAREMTLNQAVRQALREWIAHSVAASPTTQSSVPPPDAKLGREATSESVAGLLRQAKAIVAASASAKPPQPGAMPAARAQASGSTRKEESGQEAAAPAHSGPPFAWLRGAAGLDWSACRRSRAAPRRTARRCGSFAGPK
jgi:hypothetical protein